jgi:hypothetical protein
VGSVSGSRVGVAVVAGSGARGGGRRSRWYMSVPYEGLDGTDEGLDWTEEGRPGLSRLDFLTRDWTGLLRDWTEEELT